MSDPWLTPAALAATIWLVLLLARGGFWRLREREEQYDALFGPGDSLPRITAVVPARDEAGMLPQTLPALLAAYRGPFRVVLVDDDSGDGTGELARSIAASTPIPVTILPGRPLPPGWSGKLWAVSQGIDAAMTTPEPPDLLLITDADIAYQPGVIAGLAARCRRDGLVLASLMVKLRCESVAERALIPAFVFFFRMLYPFAWVNAPHRATAAAAGGCMLVRPEALAAAGGIAAIKNALIDDCALGARLKQVGPIWLGLTDRVESLRPYPCFADIGRMVARSAYTQLRHSPVFLAGTVAGMLVTYLAPLGALLFGGPAAALLGGAVLLAMAAAFLPMVRFYRLSALWALGLPAIATAYLAFTLKSFIDYQRGAGGLWKGRVQAPRRTATASDQRPLNS